MESDTARERPRARFATGWPLLACVLALAGCAAGPDYVRPPIAIEVPAAYQADRGAAAVRTAAPDTTGIGAEARWWTALGDATLNRLVDEALARNHSLAAAAARVLESRALLVGSRSARWPSAEIGGTASRSKTAINMPLGNFNYYSNQYSTAVSAHYEVDLWGRLSRAQQAAWATLLASEQNRRTVVQTLIADVVRGWIEIREQERQLTLNERTVASYGRSLELVENRYRRGIVSSLDVHLARQSLHGARAQEPAIRQNLALARRRLELLVGRYPGGLPATADAGSVDVAAGTEKGAMPAGSAVAPDQTPDALPGLLPTVPAGLPSTLLQRRPDLQAAELRLRAATAEIGQAKAALFPRLSLTADAGYRSPELAELFKETTSVWSLVGNLAMPLLNRGAQQSRIAAAEARAVQAAEAYQAAVLAAFMEVESALDAEAYQRERVEHLRDSVAQARHAMALAEDRYRRGLDNLLVTLETRRRLYNAESQLLVSERNFRSARVNLILALGGPWDAEIPEGENR